VKREWRLSPGYYQPFSKGPRHELAGTSSLLTLSLRNNF
jgi:hypothetical protein